MEMCGRGAPGANSGSSHTEPPGAADAWVGVCSSGVCHVGMWRVDVEEPAACAAMATSASA
eukprot:scaffold33435_cov112-Isochrysis_galbana.AAC.3